MFNISRLNNDENRWYRKCFLPITIKIIINENTKKLKHSWNSWEKSRLYQHVWILVFNSCLFIGFFVLGFCYCKLFRQKKIPYILMFAYQLTSNEKKNCQTTRKSNATIFNMQTISTNVRASRLIQIEYRWWIFRFFFIQICIRTKDRRQTQQRTKDRVCKMKICSIKNRIKLCI